MDLTAAIQTISLPYDNPATAVLETRQLLTHDEIEQVYRDDDAEMAEALHVVLSAGHEALGAALTAVITEQATKAAAAGSNDEIEDDKFEYWWDGDDATPKQYWASLEDALHGLRKDYQGDLAGMKVKDLVDGVTYDAAGFLAKHS